MGSTASGKNSLAPAVAGDLGAEILSMDSMKIYRGMDIGTAKLSVSKRMGIPYHLIDIIDPLQSFSVREYVEHAVEAVKDIVSRGKKPLFVGGTSLYLKALLKGIFTGPSADPELRSRLNRIEEEKGRAFLYDLLKRVDPVTASKVHANDLRRVVRALEVYFKEGIPISRLRREFDREGYRFPHRIVGLRRAREDLYERIDARVERMFHGGFLEEVRELLARDRLGSQASQALGYKEIRAFLQNGEPKTLPELVELIKKNTRHFARKQMTWLRSFHPIRWISAEKGERLSSLKERVVEAFRQG